MRVRFFFIVLIVLLVSCHDTKNDNGQSDNVIIWGDTGGLTFIPESLMLNPDKRDTIVKIEQRSWKIDAIRLIYGKDTSRLDAGKNFPRQENEQQLIDLEWIKIEKKKGSADLYVSVKENNSKEVRKCDLHFQLLEGYDKYTIRQEGSKKE